MVPMHKCEDALGKKKMEDGVYEQTKKADYIKLRDKIGRAHV